jgi:hypothetical protein
LPAVWYKIGAVIAVMKTEKPVLFAGREDSPAGTLPACQVVKLRPEDIDNKRMLIHVDTY